MARGGRSIDSVTMVSATASLAATSWAVWYSVSPCSVSCSPRAWRRNSPPTGSHHYHFILSALDVAAIGAAKGATKADVEKAMAGHVLATAELVGTYQKTPK